MKSIIIILIYIHCNKFNTNGVIVNSAVPGIKYRTQSGREDHSVYPEYKSLVGGRAELPCNVTLPTPEDAITLILWYRGENRTPIYTVDARDNPLTQAKHFVSPDTFAPNQVIFDLKTRPAILKIDPVKDDDDFEYRCRVDFRWARTMSTFVRLTVIVPPRKVIIKDEQGQPLHNLIGPYDEGSNLRLICEAEGGKPPPSLVWYRQHQMIDDSYSVGDDNKTIHNDLLIINLTRDHLNAKYTCNAVNPNFTSPIQSSVILDINLKPLNITINPLENPLSAGNSVEFVCNTVGSRPPAQITWLRDNRPLSHSSVNTVNVGNLTTSAITYTPSAEDNQAYLLCRAENLRLANSTIEIGYRLNVQYAPQLSLMMGTSTKSSNISEGDEIFMKCQINANPHTFVILFYFNGNQIVDNSNGVFINNSSLVIKSVRREHSGRYRCFANNSLGKGDSNELSLNITYIPVCKTQNRVFGAALGEKVRIVCRVEAEPPDVAFRWSVNDSHQMGSYINFGLESTLTLTLKTHRDYGIVTCKAKNSLGDQRDPCVFSIVPASLPAPVHDCAIKNQTSTSVVIECTIGDNGGLQQNFHLELYDAHNFRLIANVTQTQSAQFKLIDLTSGSQFLAYIYSSNAKGRSPNVEVQVPTLALLNKKFVAEIPHTEDMSALFAVTIALALVLVLILLIVVIICKIRTKNRRKEKQSRERQQRIDDNNSDIFVNNSKDDLTDVQESDRKNPDVIPPIDGYSVGFVDRQLAVMDTPDMESTFHQQIAPINSISSNNRVSIQTTINAQTIGNYNDKQTGIFPGADQLLCITLTPDPVVNYINSSAPEETKTIQRQRVFPLSTPV